MGQRERGAVKLSVSVPGELATGARRRVGKRGLSGFVATAMRHELDRVALGELLKELDDRHGLVSPRVLDEARNAWRRR